jgi:glycosyltransferase involved in cell wall biosynthesis
MKALVIAPQPFFSPRGTPFSVYYRTLVMAEMGIKVDLLTYGEGQDVDIPGVSIHRIPKFSLLGPVKVGPSVVKLFLDFFLLIWSLRLLLRNRYDFVHAHEEAIFFCRYLKPIFGFKLVYDMHSSLPQQLTNFRYTTSTLLIGLFRMLENACISAADAVITICPDLADYVLSCNGWKAKHVMIENSLFEPVRLKFSGGEQSKPDLNIWETISSEARVIVYAGTLEAYQGIDVLLQAFRIVRQHENNVHLLIVGGTNAQVRLYRDLARELNLLEIVAFTGRVSQMQAQALCQKAHVLVSPRVSGTNTPLKIYEQLASGIPLVATSIHSHTQTLSSQVAFLVKPEPHDMAKGLMRALSSDEHRLTVVRAAQHLYAEKYARPVYEAKMRKVLEIIKRCAES